MGLVAGIPEVDMPNLSVFCYLHFQKAINMMTSSESEIPTEQFIYRKGSTQNPTEKTSFLFPQLSTNNSSQLTQLIRVMNQLLQVTKKQHIINHAQLQLQTNRNLEPRDRLVSIALPDDRQQLTTPSLQKFIADLCQKVWSMTFNAFASQEMSFQSAKVYASEQILRNLARLCERYPMGKDHFKLINETMKGKILGYMWHKYPMKLSQEVNRNLNKMVKEVDNTLRPANDYISDTGFRFKYRENADYNDLIMKSINQALRRTNYRLERATVFESFETIMAGIFETVMDNEVMLQKELQGIQRRANESVDEMESFNKLSMTIRAAMNKKDTLEEILKENRENPTQILTDKNKYRQKVEQYTKYKIGRKIPDSTKTFSDQDIAAHHLRIQNPQILRLLSKWCEQLERKFENTNYLENAIENLLANNQHFSEVREKEMKEVFTRLLKDEKAKIDKEMLQVFQNNYMLQSALIQGELALQQSQQIEKYELIAAKSSIGIVNNLHSYTIKYLNRLIHGLLLVSAKFNKSFPQLETPIPVITFQIMDLFRSRCASGQKEIICIYQQILRHCQSQKGLELVRVVNRLNRGTNDILINLRYANVLCQVQLAVNPKNNTFIEYSNIFNHYIYQLTRSLFGPITELCSIWKCLDNRFHFYSEIKDQPPKPQEIRKDAHTKQHQELLQPCFKPFICSLCHQHYYNNVYIKNHQKCKSCPYWVCAKCEIKTSDCLSILQAAFKKDVVDRCHKLDSNEEIPEYGICVLIEWHMTKVEPFKKVSINGVERVMGRKDKKIYQIYEINGKEEKIKFKEKYLVFSMEQEFGQKRIKIEEDQIRDFFLQQKLKKVYLKHNDKICMNREKLTNEQLMSLCNTCTNINKSKILRVDLADNQLQTLADIAHMFPNTSALNLSQNALTSFQQLERLSHLQFLSLDATKIEALPPEMYELNKLKEISANKNMIRSLPPDIGQLKELRSLSLSRNSIEVLPKQISLLPLSFLNLSDNQVKAIPNHLCNVLQLQNLNMQNNNLTQINPLVRNMKNLKMLNLSHNQITAYIQQLNQVDSLSVLDLSFNKIESVPPSINHLKTLKDLNLSNNELNNQGTNQFPNIQGLWELLSLDLSNNRIEVCPRFQISQTDSIFQMASKARKLKYLSLSYNKLNYFTDIQSLVNLQQLKLNNNNLSVLDVSVGKLESLLMLRLDNNELKELPELLLANLTKLYLNRNNILKFQYHKLKKLEDLDLSDNKLNCFSSNYMPILSKINLSSNQLQKIELTECALLKSINLSHNLLTCLPKLHQKCKLRSLSLQNNSISELDEPISNLTSLKHLNLAYNKLQAIPSYVRKLRSLEQRSLELSGNPIIRIDCWSFLCKKLTAASTKQIESLGKQIVFTFEQTEPAPPKINQSKQEQSESDSSK